MKLLGAGAIGSAAGYLVSGLSMPTVLASDLQPVDVQLRAQDPISILPVVLAHQLGFFADAGLDVRLRHATVDDEGVSSTESSQLPVLVDHFERTLLLSTQGSHHRAFALIARTPQMVFGVSSLHQSAALTVKDLGGAAIGIQAFGSLSHRMALWVLLKNGVQTSDVHFVELKDLSQAMATLNAGRIQALCYEDPIATQLEISGSLRILEDLRTLRSTETVFNGPMPFTCLSVPADSMRAQPEVIQRLTHATVRALQWLHVAAPVDLMHHLPGPFVGTDRTVFLHALSRSRETFSPNGWMPEAAPGNLIQAWRRLRLPVNGWDRAIAELYTNRFVRRSLQVLRV